MLIQAQTTEVKGSIEGLRGPVIFYYRAGAAKKAIQDDKLPWMQVSDLKGFENEVATHYGIYSIPVTFLVDPDGKIIATKLRGEGLQKKLAELLDK